MKEWVKGGNPSKFRMEITAAGPPPMTSIIIFDGTSNYFYDPGTKVGFKMSAAQASSYSSESSSSTSIASYTPLYVGPETVNGVACSIYQYTASGVVTKMWISNANGMTIRTVSGTTTTDYTNYNFASIPDATFVVPSDIVIMG